MVEAVEIVVVIAFFLLALAAFSRPFLHAMRTASLRWPMPWNSLKRGALPPGREGDVGVGVREPRRPSPSGAAAAVALPEPDD